MGGFRARPLKIDTSVDPGQSIRTLNVSTKLEKDPSKDLKMRKLNDTEKFT